MNLGDIAMVASIIAGLVSVPFIASTISSDTAPTGMLVLNMSDVSEIPSEMSRSFSNEKFEQTYQTPFGKFRVVVTPEEVYQELLKPNRKVVVDQTHELTVWRLVTQDYTLEVNKSGSKVVELFTSPEGYKEVIKEMGNRKEVVKGNVEKYEEAKELLESEVQKMKEIIEDAGLPGTEKVVHVVINEVYPNPEGEDFEGEFIELYSFEEGEVDLTGWYLEDGGANYTLSGTIGSGEFKVLWRNETEIALNNNGDEIKLYDSTGKLVDEIVYETSTEGKSWARIPDGTGEFQEANPSPGEENS